jgi:hypothetical protein
MDKRIQNLILTSTGASALLPGETIQSLWSGYGSLDRYRLIGSELNSVVVKHVRMADQAKHPRGWNTSLPISASKNPMKLKPIGMKPGQ